MSPRHALFVLLLVTAACAGGHASPEAAATPSTSGTVIKGSEIGGNLLESLRGRVGAMTISYPPNACPAITFRGARSIRNQANPDVYVDGTRMLDTCILQQISSNDIDFIEVYPSGNTPRSGYQRNPFGLILIFRVKQ